MLHGFAPLQWEEPPRAVTVHFRADRQPLVITCHRSGSRSGIRFQLQSQAATH